MIYTISNNYITFEEDQKRTYPNGGKFKTNAEERHDEESYHLKPNKKQKKGGALSSTLAVKDMSSALSQGTAAEEEDTEDDQIKRRSQSDETLYKEGDDLFYNSITNIQKLELPELQQIAKNVGLTNYETLKKTPLQKLIKPIIDRRKPKANANIQKRGAAEMKKKEDKITRDINWNMKRKLRYLKLSNIKKLESDLYLNGDDISTVDKFEKALKKYNITLDYDLSIEGQVNELYDHPSNFKRLYDTTTKKYYEKATETRGHMFEKVMLSQYQDILKKLNDKSNQPDILPSDDQPRLKGIHINQSFPNTPLLSKKCLYDAFNKFLEIEFKFYDKEHDYIDIQEGKFMGNYSFTPYFCEHNGKNVLYNIWCDNINGWLNEDNFKDIFIIAFAKDPNGDPNGDIYSWSFSKLLDSGKNIFIRATIQDPKDKKKEIGFNGLKGEELYKINLKNNKEKTKMGPFEINFERTDDENWLKIPLSEMDKLT